MALVRPRMGSIYSTLLKHLYRSTVEKRQDLLIVDITKKSGMQKTITWPWQEELQKIENKLNIFKPPKVITEVKRIQSVLHSAENSTMNCTSGKIKTSQQLDIPMLE